MVSTALQPIVPRSSAKGGWVKTNRDGDVVAASNAPASEDAIRVLSRAMSYVEACEGKKSRLAVLLNCHNNSVFQWMSGEHTPSAKHLIRLLDIVLTQAESEKRAAEGLTLHLAQQKEAS